MLEKILKLYVMAMAYDVRSPMPHMFGPPGCGKSTFAAQAAKILGVNLHILNVSRMSPLELEGVQMPVTEGEGMLLRLLHSTFWTSLKEGDIVLLDEFLRGFPEVYNGLLDILTAREVAGFKLPKVFILAASNSTIAYDKALEDRLLHLPVDDPRSNKRAHKEQAQVVVDTLGLLPQMVSSFEMNQMLQTEVHPMYEILDGLKGKTSAGTSLKGKSLRNLIGQAQLREIQCDSLRELLDANNRAAMIAGKPQYVVLPDGKPATYASFQGSYPTKAGQLLGNPKLTEVQQLNLTLNLQLIELESIRNETTTGGVTDDDIFDLDDLS